MLTQLSKYIFILFTGIIIFTGCSSAPEADKDLTLIDSDATTVTENLYRNLHDFSGEGVMFGHQATLSYGYRWVSEELEEGESRSDVKDVSGSFPAVYGWDIADFLWAGSSEEEIQERMEQSANWVREGFERGGIITYAWHMSNPVTDESFYDTTAAVHSIIPGGEHHEKYKEILDRVAEFFNRINEVPVIFRPYHEHNGDWFWWGKGIASEEDYITLWKFTVEYLRDEKGVHNLIYAFSPDRSRMDIDNFKEDYMYGYPGDEYVDIIGFDNYWDLGHPANETPPEQQIEELKQSLAYTVEIAESKNKVAALTETGLEAIPDSTWWTDVMLEAFLTNENTRKISYFQVWRNANFERENRDHYYAPFPGQASAENFVEFRNHPFVYFEDDLPDMYADPVEFE
ncbi:MAG: glycosyl transferase family 1 [Bacteroidetes bacterium]|jgi:mannan endo-1,4-beta-mannosidase|nr:glycosyl transferase family 1 [Bacteroidota bacterium]